MTKSTFTAEGAKPVKTAKTPRASESTAAADKDTMLSMNGKPWSFAKEPPYPAVLSNLGLL